MSKGVVTLAALALGAYLWRRGRQPALAPSTPVLAPATPAAATARGAVALAEFMRASFKRDNFVNEGDVLNILGPVASGGFANPPTFATKAEADAAGALLYGKGAGSSVPLPGGRWLPTRFDPTVVRAL